MYTIIYKIVYLCIRINIVELYYDSHIARWSDSCRCDRFRLRFSINGRQRNAVTRHLSNIVCDRRGCRVIECVRRGGGGGGGGELATLTRGARSSTPYIVLCTNRYLYYAFICIPYSYDITL